MEIGYCDMKKYNLDDFINSQTIKENQKKQLAVRAFTNIDRKRGKARSPQKALLLIRAMMLDIRRLEEDGIIVKDGRIWKLNI